MSQSPAPQEDFTAPLRFPFLIGVYMATNAIPDAYTIVDGPDCLFFKTEFIHGKHDINSTLLDVFGSHRIALTNVNAGNVAKSRGEAVIRKIKKIDDFPNSSVIFVSSLPMVTVIGTQYDTLIREAQPGTAARLIEVPNRSLQGDWLTGYCDLLNALATNIDIEGGSPDPKKVAIIGYFMDRNEGDHAGNIKELERMCAGIGLELATVWLSGQPYARLTEVKNAGTIVSLPFGRKAGKILAKRTGAQLLECEVPFGLARTRTMLLKIAKAAGRLKEAERFIQGELAQLIPKMEWVIPHVFLGKKMMFSATPDLLGGFLQIAQDIGAEVVHLSASCSRGFLHEDLEREFKPIPPVMFEPKQAAISAEIERLEKVGVDLIICNTELYQRGGDKLEAPFVEFGFPSNFHHALGDAPYLGFAGWLGFIDRMANAMTVFTHHRSMMDKFKKKWRPRASREPQPEKPVSFAV